LPFSPEPTRAPSLTEIVLVSANRFRARDDRIAERFSPLKLFEWTA